MIARKALLLKMCLSCVLRMSEEQLVKIVPMLTSAGTTEFDCFGPTGELESRIYDCLDDYGAAVT